MQSQRATRYQVRAPVLYSWIDEGGMKRQAGGFTRNVSSGGVFVVSAMSPPIGTGISLEVMLPPLEDASPGWQLRASGKVVRVESDGFAGTTDFGQQEDLSQLSQL
jgi:hypothetical protein